MRIAQITKEYSPNGGVARYVRDLVGVLRVARHDVTVIHDDRGVVSEPGTPATFVARCTDFDAPAEATAAALAALERDAPDVVHIQGNNNFEFETEVRRRYPTVKTLHVFDYCPTNTKFHHRTRQPCVHRTGPMCLPRMVYKRCTLARRPSVLWWNYRRTAQANRNNAAYGALIVASDYVRRQALASGYAAGCVRVVPCFTEPPVAAPAAPLGADTILFVGRVEREKGLHVLLEALAKVDRAWRLVVAGDGMDRLRAMHVARRLRVLDRVRFLGWLDRDDLARCYAEATVVAVPSLWPEPFGIVGLEAMAHARPVVGFAVGGVPEWLSDGDTGFLVPPGDIGAMADRLTRLLDDPRLAASFGERGRVRVARDFSPTGHLERLLAVYLEVIAAGQRSIPRTRGDGP